MGSIYSRIKTWIDNEIVTNEDLNAEFDNILDNLVPAQMDDYSQNVAEMRSNVDPGEDGSESLATTTAGEIERLRFAIEEIKGTTYWYETASNSISGLDALLATDTPQTRLVTGKLVSSSDAQTIFLDPDGTAREVTLDADPTNLTYVISGTQYSISADTTITGLLAAPSSQNTCLVNDADLADDEFTKTLGENGTVIPIDTIGTEISSLAGKYAAFSITNGVDTEYFIAKVDTTNSTLKDARRGYFFNSSQSPVDRIEFSNNDTITLLKLTWIYANSSSALVVSYTNPTYSGDEPSSPAVGDYWFDLTNDVWKTFNSVSWDVASVVPIGVCAQTSSACVGARAFDLYKAHSSLNDTYLELVSTTVVHGRNSKGVVVVNSNPVRFGDDVPKWDITANLQSGQSEVASTTYYLYIDEFGDQFISDIAPYDRRGDLQGFYHPHKMWRSVGSCYNDSSSDLIKTVSYNDKDDVRKKELVSISADYTPLDWDEVILADTTSADVTITLPLVSLSEDRIFTFKKVSSDANSVIIDGAGSEEIDGSTTFSLDFDNESATIICDGTGWHLI